MIKHLACLVLVLIFTLNSADAVSVMSVDLGAEFMKIGIVKPGVPMEIVLNKESRRKTPLIVSLRGIEREFGDNAYFQALKKPKTAYMGITQLLGKSIDNPAVVAYKEKYPFYDIREDPETKSIYFQHDESSKYTPEEILAMLLEYARELAADFGEQPIDAAVITVPPYFNQAERKAVLKAANIANIKVLQLINTNIAAGLNYGVFRRKDFTSTGTTLMFFDMGSMGTVATVATFQLLKSDDDYEANPQLTIRSVGFDRTLGGNAFSLRLAKHLGKLFQEKTKKDPFTNPKSTLKLYKEADRIKNILSANTDHMAQIESLMDDIDFKAKVTREDFEKICADLFERVKNPVNDALKQADILDNNEISSVILVGGGTRIPKVQDELLKATNKKELGKNLNTDEAPAMGAVYQAAYMSKGYKVKKFHIKDINLYPLAVDFDKWIEPGSREKPSVVRRVLFDRGNLYPKKKFITFNKQTTDFKFYINYGDLSIFNENVVAEIGSLNISEVNLKDLNEIFEKHKDHEPKGIKVLFKMDESGVLRIERIDATFETKTGTEEEESTLSKIGNKISSFFGGNGETEGKAVDEKDEPKKESGEQTENKEEDKQKKNDDENKKEGESEKTDENASATNETLKADNSTTSANKTVQAKPKMLREDVKFNMVELDLSEEKKDSVKESKAKLQVIREKEKEKKKRAVAINSLESFIFDTRDKLSQDEFIKCSTESEREAIGNKIREVDDWLSEADDSVETKAFGDKLAELKGIAKDVFFRIKEKKLRPKRLDELKEVLSKSDEFLENTRNLTGPDQTLLPLTETEHETLNKLIVSTKEWKKKLTGEQASVADNEQPKLLANDILDKIDAIKREVGYLANKIKYFKPKPPTTKKPPTKSESDGNGTNTTNESDNSTKTGEEDETKPPKTDLPVENETVGKEEKKDESSKPPKEGEEATTDNPEL